MNELKLTQVELFSLFHFMSLAVPSDRLAKGQNCSVVFTVRFLFCILMHFILTLDKKKKFSGI